jgi:DNA-binding GntR family transcriptional regulator
VRELIPRLEAEGLLRTVPKRGLQIANVDVRLIKNAFGLRRVLERHAAEQFCATASDADLEAIEESHWALVRRAQRDGIDEQLLTDATTVDWGLHDLMIDALGNELISDAYRLNSLRVRLIRLEGSTLEADILLPVLCEHLWFIQALRARDARAVVERIDLHITSAQHRVLGLPRPVIPFRLEDYPERLRPTEGAQP